MCYTQNKLLLLLNSTTIAGPLNFTIFITFIISLNTWTQLTHWILNWQQRKYLFDAIWQHEVYLWITWNTEAQYSNTNFTINDLKEGNILTLRPFTSGNVGPDMVRIFLLWYKFPTKQSIPVQTMWHKSNLGLPGSWGWIQCMYVFGGCFCISYSITFCRPLQWG